MNIRIGDEVYWNDPDNGFSSGIYKVMDIYTENGILEFDDDILLIQNESGSVAEVYYNEVERG